MPPADVPSPWSVELIIVAGSHDGVERMALSRDVARGLLLRLRRGVYVERGAFEVMKPEHQHVVRMRGLAAVSCEPVVFSHQSAAAAHDLPVLLPGLAHLHTTAAAPGGGGRDGVRSHVFGLTASEVVQRGPLLLTAPARTVVDVAAAASFEEGVVVADGALRRGLPRSALDAAIEIAGPRRGGRRRGRVVLFAHPGAESAAESRSRTTLLRLGVEPPELQHRLVLDNGREVFLDLLFRSRRVGGEVNGAKKLLDPAMSKDAWLALLAEKRREDAVRLQLSGLAQWGWVEAGSSERLARVLQRVGVLGSTPRATLADYAAEARSAAPRAHPGR